MVTRASRGKRPKLDIETEEFREEDVKLEENYDEDYDVKTTVIKCQNPVRKMLQSKCRIRNMFLYLKTLGEILLELPTNTG
jgi:hypothetical protein